MSVNELCVRNLRVKELCVCVQELRLVCVRESGPPKLRGGEQGGTFDSRKDVN